VWKWLVWNYDKRKNEEEEEWNKINERMKWKMKYVEVVMKYETMTKMKNEENNEKRNKMKCEAKIWRRSEEM